MAVLDNILKKNVDLGVSVVGNYTSPRVDIDNTEQGYVLQLTYSNGVGPVDVDMYIEASSDGVNYAELPDSRQQITDTSGVGIWDVAFSNTTFVRVVIEHTTGSMDVDVIYTGKRNH